MSLAASWQKKWSCIEKRIMRKYQTFGKNSVNRCTFVSYILFNFSWVLFRESGAPYVINIFHNQIFAFEIDDCSRLPRINLTLYKHLLFSSTTNLPFPLFFPFDLTSYTHYCQTMHHKKRWNGFASLKSIRNIASGTNCLLLLTKSDKFVINTINCPNSFGYIVGTNVGGC